MTWRKYLINLIGFTLSHKLKFIKLLYSRCSFKANLKWWLKPNFVHSYFCLCIVLIAFSTKLFEFANSVCVFFSFTSELHELCPKTEKFSIWTKFRCIQDFTLKKEYDSLKQLLVYIEDKCKVSSDCIYLVLFVSSNYKRSSIFFFCTTRTKLSLLSGSVEESFEMFGLVKLRCVFLSLTLF